MPSLDPEGYYPLAKVLATRGESPGTPLWGNVAMVARRAVVCEYYL